ncbi:alpha/beta fold hydrolase [Halomonas denitrificans]|nr:alpha/beta fold hydrolase [Halomonas denitrificans]
MAHEERTVAVEADDGHRFELIEIGPNEGPTLLFLPGMGISARNLIPFGRMLGERGVRVLLHEWRGNGSSSLRARRGVDWGYDELLDLDLPAAIAAAHEGAGHRGLWLGGHSLGSQLACLAAALAPRRIEGLALVAGGAPYWRCYPAPAGIGLLAMLTLLPALVRVLGYYPGKRLGFAGTEARQLMLDWARTGRTGRYAWGRPTRDEDPALARLALPVHVVAMEHDRFVPRASMEWLLGKLTAAPATCNVVTDSTQGRSADHFGWMRSPSATAAILAPRIHGTAPAPDDPTDPGERP